MSIFRLPSSRRTRSISLACNLAAEALEPRRLFSTLPAPMLNTDIGTPTGGSASYNVSNGTYTVSGAGFDNFGAADASQFVYTSLTGDGSVTVQVTGDSANNAQDLAGLNIRDSLAPDAANLWLANRDDGTVFVDHRSDDGGTGVNDLVQGGALGDYLQITRSGDTVTAAVSSDGVSFTTIDTQTINFSSSTVLVGMSVSSQTAPQNVATATFANFVASPTGASESLTAPSVANNTNTPYNFTVTYNAPNGVNASSIGNGNWVVQLPDGTSENATLVTSGLTNGTPRTAVYSIPAPTQVGTYIVTPGASPVTDLSGNAVAAGSNLGTFNVTQGTNPTGQDSISGLVRTPTLAPIAGATVTADGIAATTDSSGAYTISGLPDGTYTVSETAPAGQQVLPHVTESVAVSGSQNFGNVNFVNTQANTSSTKANLTGVFAKNLASSAPAGTLVSSSVKVKNTGKTTINQSINITELLTTDGTASSAVGALNTSAVSINLKPGQSKIVPVSFQYPTTTAVGTYKVVGIVDSTNVVPEANKLDNVFTSGAVSVTSANTKASSIVANIKSAPKVTHKASTYRFSVTYTAINSLVNPLRIGNNNWVVVSPTGTIYPTLLTQQIKKAVGKVTVYYIAAGPTTSGTYTIETSHDRAADLAGDQVAAGNLATFTVSLPTKTA